MAIDHGEAPGRAPDAEYDLANSEAHEIAEDPPIADEAWDEPIARSRFDWLVPTLAVLAILGWSGFFGWVHRSAFVNGATPQAWSDLVVAWAVPVLLVIALWLLAMRTSTREAARFNDAARELASESAQLERRLAVVNRELSLARDFIASQSRDLESLGRVASERLSTHAEQLQGLIRDNSAQIETIGQVSETALGNMDRLRDHLPVIANAARDVASQIGQAGNTAQSQADELSNRLDQLNQFGRATSQQVEDIHSKVSETLATFEQQTGDLDRATAHRFETLRNEIEDFRNQLEARETDVLAAIRRRAHELSRELAAQAEAARTSESEALDALRERLGELHEHGNRLTSNLRDAQENARISWNSAIEQLEARMRQAIGEIARIDEAALGSARERLANLTEEAARVDRSIVDSAAAFEDQLAERRQQASTQQAEAISAMEQRLSAFDASVVERQQEHLAHVSGLAERGEALAARLAGLDTEMKRLAAEGQAEGRQLGEAADLLADKLSQSRAILEESGSFVSRLTDDSVRLLELIRASADHSTGALSQSISEAEGRLAQFERHAVSLHAMIGEAATSGATLAGHIETANRTGGASLETLAKLQQGIATVAEDTEALARQARGELQEAIEHLGQAATQTIDKLRSDQADTVREIASHIGSDANTAIARALSEGAHQAISELEQAAAAAGERGRETAKQLRDQLAMVNELTGNLEQRVTQARERAHEKVDSDFSRRMALITESLNSSAIDISKAFDVEVTDTAWASYLRGDRGIFTRRAVRLLDSHDARSVTEIYEQDGEFRETVNRYIHDFEAMLRQILSTRDGHALAVTLLSSDIGKLYVALAQAIERLRG